MWLMNLLLELMDFIQIFNYCIVYMNIKDNIYIFFVSSMHKQSQTFLIAYWCLNARIFFQAEFEVFEQVYAKCLRCCQRFLDSQEQDPHTRVSVTH